MDYSVYILAGDDTKNDDIINGLCNDVNLKTMAGDALFSAIENLTGVSFHDRYAMMLTCKESVALTGGVVTDLTYNTQIIFGQQFEFSGDNDKYLTDVRQKFLKHILTVKGILDPSSAFLGIPQLKDLYQRKDPSKLWMWANAPVPNDAVLDPEVENGVDKYEEMLQMYYRHVVAQVYSDSQSVFRELVLKDATVASYDEYYDENGEGHFTLVINKSIALPKKGKKNTGITMTGPTFERTFSSTMSDISKAAKTAKKDLDTGLAVAEKLAEQSDDEELKERIKRTKDFSKGSGKVVDSLDTIVSGGGLNFDAETLVDQVTDQKENFEKNFMDKDVFEKSKTTTEYYTEGNNKIEKTTTVNEDGSRTVVTTTKDKEGNVISVKTEKFAV